MTIAEREDLYRRCLISGMTPTQADEFCSDEEQRRAVEDTASAISSRLDALASAHGG